MNEISLAKRNKVLKLFFSGISYDDIARQIGIGKGSVVNIIEELREGDLAVPSDITEYVDALRKTSVDLLKHSTSISQVMSYVSIHAKFMEMDVDIEKTKQLIEACQEITSPGTSGNEFINAAMELVQSKSETGLSYKDLISDYKTKKSERNELQKELEQEYATLAQIKSENKKEQEKAAKELESITLAMTTTQELFQKQKDSLKSELDDYLAQNKLSWNKVNTAATLLETELGKSGFSKREVDQLSERIRYTGSLINIINQLKQEYASLQPEVAKLTHEVRSSTDSVNKLREIDENFRKSISTNQQESDKIISELTSKMEELEEVKQTTYQYSYNLYISRLIIDFLFVPGSIQNYDLDRLVSLMIGLRQKWLGIEPKQVLDKDGNILCKCDVPRMYGTTDLPDAAIIYARSTFAQLLTPLVKDQFVSRRDYDMAELMHETSKTTAVAQAIIDESNRHLL